MSGDPRSLKCKHLCDPQSFLTVTFWLLDNFSSTGREYHSHLFVSVSHHVTPPRLREEREMNRNIIEKKKAIQFTVLSPFLSFFFSLYFSFIPFLLHALTNSFLFLFSSFLIFTIGENNFTSLSFFLSLSLFFFFNLVFLSFFSSLDFWPYHISNFEEVSPSFFLRHFWRLYNFNCQALGEETSFSFLSFPYSSLVDEPLSRPSHISTLGTRIPHFL